MMLSHHLMPLETRRTTASNGTAGTWKWCFCLLKATCNFLPHPLLTWESSPTITVLKAACDYLQKPAAHRSRVLPRPPSIPSRHPGPASPQFLVSAASKRSSWHTESFAEQFRVCRGQRHKDPFPRLMGFLPPLLDCLTEVLPGARTAWACQGIPSPGECHHPDTESKERRNPRSNKSLEQMEELRNLHCILQFQCGEKKLQELNRVE